MFKVKILWLEISKKMWPKVTLFAILSVILALLAVVLKGYVPVDPFDNLIHTQTINDLLTILATSMLAVATFSLSSMVSAYNLAITSTTPRAAQLIMEDPITQNVMATFVGSFIYSLVGLIALNLGVYHKQGRFILFIVTLLVIILIVIMLIKWIDHLTKLGRLVETLRQLEKAAEKAIKDRAKDPCLGANCLNEKIPEPEKNHTIYPEAFGYVQYINMEKLNKTAETYDTDFYINIVPGAYVTSFTPLILSSREVNEEISRAARRAFIIHDVRSYEQDPRFGICVMTEIVTKSLTDEIDTGTAIDIIGRLVRLLSCYNPCEKPAIKFKRLWISALDVGDLFQDAFGPIARDAGRFLEVQVRLQKSLTQLYETGIKGFRENALKQSFHALQYSNQSSMPEQEKKELEKTTLVFTAKNP